jgi:hypothetical protein
MCQTKESRLHESHVKGYRIYRVSRRNRNNKKVQCSPTSYFKGNTLPSPGLVVYRNSPYSFHAFRSKKAVRVAVGNGAWVWNDIDIYEVELRGGLMKGDWDGDRTCKTCTGDEMVVQRLVGRYNSETKEFTWFD